MAYRAEYKTCLICGNPKKPNGNPHHEKCARDLKNLKRRLARQMSEGEEFDEVRYGVDLIKAELERLNHKPGMVMGTLGEDGDELIIDLLVRARRL